MTPEEIAAMQAENLAFKVEAEKNKAKPPPIPIVPPPEDASLEEKAKKDRETKEAASKNQRSLESAINFSVASKEFIKNNKALLPPSIESLFTQADKETYDSAIEKANAIKVGIVSEFFLVQANMDQLTGPQKIEVDNFFKLTKTGKQDRVENVYSMIFEPTLEMARKIEKARQLNNGDKNQTDGEKVLADRMMKMSRQHYLGET